MEEMITFWITQTIVRKWRERDITADAMIAIIEEEIPDIRITRGETAGQFIDRAMEHIGWGDVMARLVGLPRDWDTSTVPTIGHREDVMLTIDCIDITDGDDV